MTNDINTLEKRIRLLEDAIEELEELVDSVCDLLEAKEVIKLPVQSLVERVESYGGTK